MFTRVVVLCVAVIAIGVDCSATQIPIPEEDRYIKLGTRFPELPPGEGGDVRIVVDQDWCRDAAYILELRVVLMNTHTPVARLATGPSNCTWLLERMPVGQYEALILTAREQRIVTVGHGTLTKGSTMLITLQRMETEIEGRVVSRPLPSPLRLRFVLPDGNSWTTRVAADGGYRVVLGDTGDVVSVAIWAEADGSSPSEPTAALNIFPANVVTIWRGGHVRHDVENVSLPPVVVHVEVPPLDGAGVDEFAELRVDDKRGEGFKLKRGLCGQFLATYGDHSISVWTLEGQRMLATTTVSVDAPKTELRAVVRIPRLLPDESR
jgi:hypothetical protein